MCDVLFMWFLIVLYEHKTRLENAVSQEKEIAKKTKDGNRQNLLSSAAFVILSQL